MSDISPKVTVLMTVYNGMPYLPAAIESVLNQSFKDFEFLIINDCATDTSRDVILSYNDPRIRLIDNDENIKQTRSLNKGLGLAKGEIISRLDADDIAHSRCLEVQVAYLERHPEVAVVGANHRFIDEKGRVTGKCSRPEGDLALRWLQFFVCPIGCGTVAFRKSIIWDKLGGFDESIKIPQDWELWSRVLPEHKVGNIPKFLVDIRAHPNCETSTGESQKMTESARIARLNPKRLLGLGDQSKQWLRKVDTLLQIPVEQPEERIAVIRVLFDRFSYLHPAASRDTEVIQQVLIQYARTILYARPSKIPSVIRALRSQWPVSLSWRRVLYHFPGFVPFALEWKLRK